MRIHERGLLSNLIAEIMSDARNNLIMSATDRLYINGLTRKRIEELLNRYYARLVLRYNNEMQA